RRYLHPRRTDESSGGGDLGLRRTLLRGHGLREVRRLCRRPGREIRLQRCQRLVRCVHQLEEREVSGVNDAVLHHGLEIDDLAPVSRTIEEREEGGLYLSRLGQREEFEEFVQRAETAGKH